jgi:ATP-dependent DNA ligase
MVPDPNLATAADAIPNGEQWTYEPKWDGFRSIITVDLAAETPVELSSRNQRPLTRYFPELVEPLKQAAAGCVIDAEIVVEGEGGLGLDFDRLAQRIHPAVSRVNRLAAQTPARVVVFDVLAVDGTWLLDQPLRERRRVLTERLTPNDTVLLTPWTNDEVVAADWFTRFEGAGLDGIVAKQLDGVYQPGTRSWVKVKHQRTADCVVAGYRVHKDGKGAGSLLLGLHDDDGRLHHVGVATGFTAKQRAALLTELAPLIPTDLSTHPWREWAEASAHEVARLPGAQSRWTGNKDLSFTALNPSRVCEVAFSQLQHNRFRHATSFKRWRPDRDAASCRYDQLDVATPVALADLMAAER